jgi:hypothetical protein
MKEIFFSQQMISLIIDSIASCDPLEHKGIKKKREARIDRGKNTEYLPNLEYRY